ncbi:unnamed protein product, partial [marine sediment metagenome]
QFTEDKRSIAIAHYRLGLINLKGEVSSNVSFIFFSLLFFVE